ncbi:PREDICTED: phospholipase A1 member A-like [Trachymyrmex cornetzi]|uniref:phospholipase A1 member A-like n=1 Tax=Trachymyrmex cornetzi TaxID=471704 RepID=UPI00084F3556|nr:PREDICTED: phospholipase A1 member A-like [Trachymyrmex cornetzi]
MKSYIFQQFVFTIVIIYASTIDGVPIEEDLKSIFLRIYVGITIHEYIDCSLENASAITSRLNTSKPTVMYIHGFSENVEKKSVQTIVQAYLKRNDHNIIAVDYSKFANDSYVTVTRNAPRVANALTMILDKMAELDFDTEKLHVIGHSMGSQISGYIGRKVNFKIPRITGLDPAGPLYNFLQPHLSLFDARFVDIIHTDYGFYGIARITGTVDFFPNGGQRIQPGCPHHPKFYSKDDFCSHHRSWKFYAESLINESAFLGVQCSSLSHLASGKCNNNTQIIMGYATPSSAQGTVYLLTADQSPFGLKEQGLLT